jgi:OCT family organic cation transporter-like MFS transporter 4/5
MLAGNEYLNFLISGAVEIPGYFVAGVSIRYFGRRWPLCVTMAVGGIALLVTMGIPDGRLLMKLLKFYQLWVFYSQLLPI